MKKLVSILAALLLLPSVALAAEWSADLEGANASQEGFASVVTTTSGNISYTIMTNGIGVPTRAAIRQGGADIAVLNTEFEFGRASGVLGTGSDLSGLLGANLVLRVEGPDGNIEGPLVLLPGPDINASTLQVRFGDVTVGGTSANRGITISNDGTENLRLRRVLIRGSGRAQYNLVSENCATRTLAPNASCLIQVSFSPSAAGDARALVVVNTPDDPNEPQVRVQLRGTGN